jgi:hypothetical protein
MSDAPASGDLLPSWEDTAAKRAVTDFVAAATAAGGPGFVPPAERVAVFDNDGTLWCEKPLVIQLDFTLRRMAALAAQALERARAQGWTVVSIKDDWATFFVDPPA